MVKRVIKLARGTKGEGVLTGVIWMGVVAIVCGLIAVAVWTNISGDGTTAKTNVTNSMNTAVSGASSLTP